MRVFGLILAVGLGLCALPSAGDAQSGKDMNKLRQKCGAFGYQPGTDAFADCVMRLSMRQQQAQPDRESLLRRYRERSMSRRGDDRYPICTASMMNNELDTSMNKWVGPSCKMAPD